MQIEDIPSGESWACRFRTTTFVDAEGEPVSANLQRRHWRYTGERRCQQ